MTKEEVAQVITYCEENKISYKQHLAELGVNPCSFYDEKPCTFRKAFNAKETTLLLIITFVWMQKKEIKIKIHHYGCKFFTKAHHYISNNIKN